MHELEKRAAALDEQLRAALSALDIDSLEKQLGGLIAKSQSPDFWQASTVAQETMKKIASLENRMRPWRELQTGLRDVHELLALGDTSLQSDISDHLKELEKTFAAHKKELQFSGPYDDHDAIVSIYAGAGGTDAQDWAEMLLRMYVRWAESHQYSANIIDQSSGEEAGLKSVTLEIAGPFAFGKLKGEHGVHRLVRLSPFNADNLRQTSFAKVEVLPKIDTPDTVELDDKDLKVDVFRSGGHGGQSVNTTDSAVRVTHLPTGITVAIQNERSQLQNKETALTIVRSKLAQLQLEQHKEKVSELKGPNQSAEWGSQIRNYVLHPYKQVKDVRSGHESSDPDKVLDGQLDDFIDAYLEQSFKK
jgi:peptide chain release factor 2